MSIKTTIKNPKRERLSEFSGSIFNPEKIIQEDFNECFNTFNTTYDDYIGIYHQIMAIELGYVTC